jgi:hypothetical protein
MTPKQALTLVTMILAAMALAAPGTASAATEIRKHGTAIGVGEQVHFHGDWGFETLGSGFECPVTAVLTSSSKSTGTVTQFNVNPHSCEGFGELYEGCTLEHIEYTGNHPSPSAATSWPAPANPGWQWHVGTHNGTEPAIWITDLEIHQDYAQAACLDITLTFPGGITLIPDNPNAAGTGRLEGEGEAHTEIGELPNVIFGHMNVTPVGTYSLV